MGDPDPGDPGGPGGGKEEPEVNLEDADQVLDKINLGCTKEDWCLFYTWIREFHQGGPGVSTKDSSKKIRSNFWFTFWFQLQV